MEVKLPSMLWISSRSMTESPTVRGFSRSDLAANGFTNVETLFLPGIALERGGDCLLVAGELPEELGT